MEGQKSLPFAAYDIAVYLPGGAVILVILATTLEAWFPSYEAFPALIFGDGNVGDVIRAVFFLAISYLTGHVASFVSTYLIEKFIHNNIGFPSEIWIKSEDSYASSGFSQGMMKPIFREKISNRNATWVAKAIIFAQVPAFHFILICKHLLPFGFYTPKIPLGIKKKVITKFDKLNTGIAVSAETRWEKIVEHHVANRCPSAYARMYNYLMIYGALRLIALTMLMLMWLAIIQSLWMIATKFLYDADIVFDIGLAIQMFFLSCVYTVCLMAFAKFNRRYFEESILGFLLSDAEIHEVHSGPAIRRP